MLKGHLSGCNGAFEMNISEAAGAAGLTTKALRYYEQQGVVVPSRTGNGYRTYSQDDVDALQFISRARSTGFSVDEARQLLSLYRNPARQSAEVKQLAVQKLQLLTEQIDQLHSMKHLLEALVQKCPGDQSPDCVIIEELSGREGV